jgi:hypothetical protein
MNRGVKSKTACKNSKKKGKPQDLQRKGPSPKAELDLDYPTALQPSD